MADNDHYIIDGDCLVNNTINHTMANTTQFLDNRFEAIITRFHIPRVLSHTWKYIIYVRTNDDLQPNTYEH